MKLTDTFKKNFEQAETGELETASYPARYDDLVQKK
jgi:hypothetical protein